MFLLLCTQCLASYPGFPLFFPHFGSLVVSRFFFLTSPFGLRSYPELCLNSSNPSICVSLLHGGFDALLFPELANLHLLLLSHWVPDWHGIFLTIDLYCKGNHFRPQWLTSGLCNADRLCNQALPCDHFAQIRHVSIKFFFIHFWLGADNIDCCLQLRAPNALEKMADFGAIVHTTLAIIHMALHNGMLFFVEGNMHVPIPCLSLSPS